MPAGSPGWIFAHPTLPIIYVASSSPNFIRIMDINGNVLPVLRSELYTAGGVGNISLSTTQALPLNSSPSAVEISHNGEHLYVGNWDSQSIDQFSLSGNQLTSSGPNVPCGGAVWGITLSPDDHFIYALEPYGNQISQHAVQGDGTINTSALLPDLGAVAISFWSSFAFITSFGDINHSRPIQSRTYDGTSGLSSVVNYTTPPARGQYTMIIVE